MSRWLTEAIKPIEILLVEDDDGDSELFESCATDFNAVVLRVRTAEQALETLREKPNIKMAVLDERLPGMSGLKLWQILHETRIDIKVVFFAGQPGTLVEQVQEIGFAIVMAKPSHNLKQNVSEMLRMMDVPTKPSGETQIR